MFGYLRQSAFILYLKYAGLRRSRYTFASYSSVQYMYLVIKEAVSRNWRWSLETRVLYGDCLETVFQVSLSTFVCLVLALSGVSMSHVSWLCQCLDDVSVRHS